MEILKTFFSKLFHSYIAFFCVSVCTVMKQSIPLVPWYVEHRNILMHQPFIMLLHKLGFHLPADSGKVFARIPDFWTADVLFSIAEKLGPIDTCKYHLN